MLNGIFKAILLTSAVGTAFTLFLLGIRPITKKFFIGSWHYYMWLSVLLAMLIPIRIDLPEPEVNIPTAATQQNIAVNTTETVPTELQKAAPSPIHTAEIDWNILSVIWLTVAVGLFVAKIINYRLFLSKMKKISQTAECDRLKAYTNRKITVRKSEKLSSPVMVGIFKPVLVLPMRELTPEQLDHILSHEITHFKRKDIVLKWFSNLAKCVHWFNPAVYFVVNEINAECEISCDVSVTQNMSKREKTDYANTILTLLSENKTAASFSTGMTGNKKILKRRFTMIKNTEKVNKKVRIISSAVATLIIISVLFISGVFANEFLKSANDNLTFIYPHSGTVSNSFGKRVHPVTGAETSHSGIDIKGQNGDAVIASEKGEVTDTGYNPENGNYILIRHSDELETFYAHLSEIGVKTGDNVTQGQPIGKVGNTGMSTGSHLHFEVRKNGEPVNPENLLIQ